MRKPSFGLGYFDGPAGELTHHFWCSTENVARGPYVVLWMVYQTGEQFLELMEVIRGLGDQVRLIQMVEPRDIQLQDLIDQPFTQRRITRQTHYETGAQAVAYWQMRMCDVRGCLERTHLRGGEVCFNLTLTDPIERYLPEGAPWRGVAGGYVVTLGPSSGAERGHAAGLPTLHTTVNAFTRLWLGVRPATGLAITDELHGPAELLEQLDEVLLLPEPRPEWDL
jgi:hypothetical protein